MPISLKTHRLDNGDNTIQIPQDAKVKDVFMNDYGEVSIITMGDHQSEKKDRFFSLIGCGENLNQDIGIDWEYVGSVSYGTRLLYIVECVA